MKRFLKFCSLMLAGILLFAMTETKAFALSAGVDSGVAGKVVQGGTAETFMSSMPFAMHRVYPSGLRVGGTTQSSFKSYDTHFVQKDYYNNAVTADMGDHASSIVFVGTINGSGSYTKSGTAFEITYAGAAIDASGATHDVTLSFSDVTIRNFSGTAAKSATLVTGAVSATALLWDKSFSAAEVASGLSASDVSAHHIPKCAVEMTVTMTINGAEIPGGLNISFRDLDTGSRDIDNAGTAASYDGNYSERVNISGSSILSKAYLTRASGSPSNLLRVSAGMNGGLLFRSTALDEGTYYSGFGIQVTPKNVIKWTGGSCGTTLYGGTSTIAIRPLTKLYDNTNSKISDTWTVSDVGGTISMKDTVNNDVISWSNETIKYGGNKYVARFYSDTKDALFTAGAKEGYELVGMNYTTTNNSVSPTEGAVTLNASKQWSHKLENGNGSHYAAAFYQPVVKSLKIHKQDQDGNPVKGVTFTATGTSSVHGAFSVSGTTDGNGNVTLANIPYGKGTDEYSLSETLPDGYRAITPSPWTFHYSDLGKSTTDPDVTFVNQQVFSVSYAVENDPTWGAPEGAAVPTDSTKYDKGADVTLKDPLSTTKTYAVNSASEQVPGTWKFTPESGWSQTKGSYTTGVNKIEGISKNETVYGAWKFTPETRNISYDITGDDAYGVPTDSTTPADTTVDWGTDATLASHPTTTWTTSDGTAAGVPGTWEFEPSSGWSATDGSYSNGVTTIEHVTENQTVYGKWKFTPDVYEVNYDVDGDPTYGVPTGGEAPTDTDNPYDYKETVTVKDDPTTTWTTSDGTDTGIPGTWTFSGWDKDDFSITEDTTITGSWKFDPYVYEVTYDVDGDPDFGTPAGGEPPTDTDNPYDYKETVTVKDDLTTTWTTSDGTDTGIPGTWTFSGWDKDDFSITEDTTIKGTWKFTPDVYEVNYDVDGDPTYGMPTGGEAPTDTDNPYDYKELVTVKDDPTTTWTTSDGTDTGIPGTWTFSGWDTDDFNITEDTTITGSWKFDPYVYEVTYTVKGDPDYGTPADCVKPTDDNNPYDYKETVTVKDNPTTTWTTSDGTDTGIPGTWTFNGWDTDSFEITEDTVFTGSWTFTPETRTVAYEVNGDPDYGTPEDSVVPTDDNSPYDYGSNVTVKPILTSKQEWAKDPVTGEKIVGKWTFGPWDHENFKITEDTIITGGWVFTPKPPTYTVTYHVGEDIKWGHPTDSYKPADANEYGSGDPVTVKPDLKTIDSFAIDPITNEKVPGTWIFSGWDTEDFNIKEDTIISGSWEFVPDVKVTYDPKPDPKWGKPEGFEDPLDTKTFMPGSMVTIDPVLKTVQGWAKDPTTGEKVYGTWTFSPWDHDDFEITEDTVITGTWKFTPAGNKKPDPEKRPVKTGDTNSVALWIVLMAASAAVLFLTLTVKKRIRAVKNR